MVELQHTLVKAGHDAYFCRNHLQSPGMNLGRVQKLVNQSPADAWIVAGGSREVLEWFSGRPVPTFALFGRPAGLRPSAPVLRARGPAAPRSLRDRPSAALRPGWRARGGSPIPLSKRIPPDAILADQAGQRWVARRCNTSGAVAPRAPPPLPFIPGRSPRRPQRRPPRCRWLGRGRGWRR
jgi:hypothetical protein